MPLGAVGESPSPASGLHDAAGGLGHAGFAPRRMTVAFALPPRARTTSGRPRLVGVEIEFAELDVAESAAVVAAALGGEVRRRTEYEYDVAGSSLGDVAVELDSSLLKKMALEREGKDESWLERLPGDVLAAVSRQFVPLEVVTAPIPIDRLGETEALVTALRDAGARGTEASPLFGFGVHFNVEPPGLEASELLAYARAFAVLERWLRLEVDVDDTRRLAWFIRPWPRRYVQRILAADYAPGLETLIDDYVERNPTRNRAFDLLPLLAHLDEPRVRAVVDDPLLSPRPAFHYRLANSRVGDPSWSLADEWAHWVAVERLANDPDRLDAMAARLRRRLEDPFPGALDGWEEDVARWLG